MSNLRYASLGTNKTYRWLLLAALQDAIFAFKNRLEQDKKDQGGNCPNDSVVSVPYVLKKHGMYYAHNACGYVDRVLLAELYEEKNAKTYAERHEGISAIPVTELLTSRDEVQEYIDRLEVMKKALAH